MYGTIAKLKAKDGVVEHIRKMEAQRHPMGYMGTFIYQSDNDPHEIWMIAMYDSKESYWANAKSSEQDREYFELRKLLLAEPEWHDGEIVFAIESIPQPC
jgi:hypothetical protein